MCLARLLEEGKIKGVNKAKQFLSGSTIPREINRVEKHGHGGMLTLNAEDMNPLHTAAVRGCVCRK